MRGLFRRHDWLRFYTHEWQYVPIECLAVHWCGRIVVNDKHAMRVHLAEDCPRTAKRYEPREAVTGWAAEQLGREKSLTLGIEEDG
jgi:hypothetical protein